MSKPGYVAVVLCTSLFVLTSQSAVAFELWGGGDCTETFWADDPTIEINVSSGDYDTMAKESAVIEILDRIEAVTGAWIAPDYSESTSSGLSNNQSEIWISTQVTEGYGVTIREYNGLTCEIIEADVLMDLYTDWVWPEPSDFYDPNLGADEFFIRFGHMHELLHVMGLAHEVDNFSSMLYLHGDGEAAPFTNRPTGEKIDPTNDDRDGLRHLYTTATVETDIAVSNIWFDPSFSPGKLTRLCMPAAGLLWNARFANYCSVLPVTNVCPGQAIRSYFNVMNYGQDGETVTIQAWLSANDTWSSLADYQMDNTFNLTIGGENALLQQRAFDVPDDVLMGTDYFMIVRIVPISGEESTQNNWIPLRGNLHVKTKSECS